MELGTRRIERDLQGKRKNFYLEVMFTDFKGTEGCTEESY